MRTFTELLNNTLENLNGDHADPDGPALRQGLLLAAHAGLTVDPGQTSTANWDLYAMAVSNALTTLQTGLPHDQLLASDLPDAGADDPLLRDLVRSLVGQLADRYAEAAAGYSNGSSNNGANGLSPVRRLVWAEVANYLDDAAAHLA